MDSGTVPAASDADVPPRVRTTIPTVATTITASAAARTPHHRARRRGGGGPAALGGPAGGEGRQGSTGTGTGSAGPIVGTARCGEGCGPIAVGSRLGRTL